MEYISLCITVRFEERNRQEIANFGIYSGGTLSPNYFVFNKSPIEICIDQ